MMKDKNIITDKEPINLSKECKSFICLANDLANSVQVNPI
jgi:hypothetical protein